MINGNIFRWGTSCPGSGGTPPVPQPPTVTVDPADIDGFEGDTGTMIVRATGAATLAYQWQWNFDGTGWVDAEESQYLSGVTDSNLSFLNLNRFLDDVIFRCVVTNDLGSDTSESAGVQVYEDYPFPFAIWAGESANGNRVGWDSGDDEQFGFAIPDPGYVESLWWNDGVNNIVVETLNDESNGEFLEITFGNVPELPDPITLPWDASDGRYELNDETVTDALQALYDAGQRFFTMSAEWRDYDIPNPVGHFNETSMVMSGDEVIEWEDVGGDDSWTHISIGNITAEEVNGILAPTTALGTRLRTPSNKQLTGDKAIFMVVVPDAVLATDQYFMDARSGTANRAICRLASNGNILIMPSNYSGYSGSPAIVGQPNIVMYARVGDDNFHRQNDEAEVTVNGGGHTTTNIGSMFSDSGNSRRFIGSICEVVIFNDALTEVERNVVWDGLAAKWTT